MITFGDEQQRPRQERLYDGLLVGKYITLVLIQLVRIPPLLTILTLACQYSFDFSGTHLNYYMFFGGYNRGRQAAGGISNQYATDAALCSSGQRHQPKFNHYQSLHKSKFSYISLFAL